MPTLTLPPDLDRLAPLERLFSTAEYHALVASGALGRAPRVELIDGRIVSMSPTRPPHYHTLRRLGRLLRQRLFESDHPDIDIVVQSPIALLDGTEPEPDLVLLRPETPEDRIPGPSDALLVVEVSDATLDYDRTVKLARYASAGVTEVWTIDVAGRAVWVSREPQGRRYTHDIRHAEGDAVAVAALDLAPLPVSDLLPDA